MDKSRDFDLDRMMEQIRLKVRDLRHSQSGATAAVGLPAGHPQLERDLAELHQAYNLTEVSLDPRRRVLGWTMLTAAKALRALLKPIVRRQSEYNAANARLMTAVTNDVDRLCRQVVEMRAVTEQVISRSAEDVKAHTRTLARRFADTYAADIQTHAAALGDLSRRMAALERLRGQWEALSQRIERLQEYEEQLGDEKRTAGEQARRLESLEARCAELGAAVAAAQARAAYWEEQFKPLHERVRRVERRLRRLGGEPSTGAAAPPALESAAAPAGFSAIDYAGFEERLRDSTMVKDKQRGYLRYFTGKAPVLDIGCGKGEFLELMREAGIAAKGLDLDLDMILLCRDKGLDVEQCDALEYLAAQPDASLGGIFSAQVIEHLPASRLSALISLSWRKLMPGGVAVLETLNPESLFVHYKWFWMDPSHVRLVHPQTLQFLLESEGFAEISCHLASPPADVLRIPPLQGGVNGALDDFNRATDYLNKLIYGDQEYFVVARK